MRTDSHYTHIGMHIHTTYIFYTQAALIAALEEEERLRQELEKSR